MTKPRIDLQPDVVIELGGPVTINKDFEQVVLPLLPPDASKGWFVIHASDYMEVVKLDRVDNPLAEQMFRDGTKALGAIKWAPQLGACVITVKNEVQGKFLWFSGDVPPNDVMDGNVHFLTTPKPVPTLLTLADINTFLGAVTTAFPVPEAIRHQFVRNTHGDLVLSVFYEGCFWPLTGIKDSDILNPAPMLADVKARLDAHLASLPASVGKLD